MKIRTDFVTNSSSSSFCIVGIAADSIMCDNYSDLVEELYKDDLDFSYISEPEYGYIGFSIETMKEDQTLGDFKKQVHEALVKKFPKDDIKLENIHIRIDGGYDG